MTEAPPAWGDVVLMSDPAVTSVQVVESGPRSSTPPGSSRPPRDTPRRGCCASRCSTASPTRPPRCPATWCSRSTRAGARPRCSASTSSGTPPACAAAHPDADAAEVHRLASRFVSPPEVAPHTAGAAVDVLLTTPEGEVLDVGCPVDASPEASGGRCYTGHPDVTGEALALRRELVRAMAGAGLVNYPTEWWHWSWGDRYWAHATGAAARDPRARRVSGRPGRVGATRARRTPAASLRPERPERPERPAAVRSPLGLPGATPATPATPARSRATRSTPATRPSRPTPPTPPSPATPEARRRRARRSGASPPPRPRRAARA